MKIIELSDDQVAAVAAKAAEHGLTLEDWFKGLAVEEPAGSGGVQLAAEIVLEESLAEQNQVGSVEGRARIQPCR